MKLDVYGKQIEVIKTVAGWQVFYLGVEGKKRLARDIVIPANMDEDAVIDYLADLLHEWATSENQHIKRLA